MKNKAAESSSGGKKRKNKVNTTKVQQTPKETSKNEESINGHDNKPERPFKCEICSRQFNMRQALSTHMRLHRLEVEEAQENEDMKDVVDFETLIDETRSSDSGSLTRAPRAGPRAGSKRKAP